MKIFTNRKVLKKIAIFLIIITMCSFIMPINNSNAAKANQDSEGTLGGKMLQPIIDLLMHIGDAILNILQNNFLAEADILIPANSKDYGHWNWWATLGIAIGIIAVVVGICVLWPVFSGATFAAAIGSSTGIWATLTASAKTVYVFAIGSAVITGGAVVGGGSIVKLNEDFKGAFDIPVIQYTPYTIFSGQIPALDINFIEPMPAKYETKIIEKNILGENLEPTTNQEQVYDIAVESGINEENNNKVITEFSYSASSLCQIYVFPTNKEDKDKFDLKVNKLKAIKTDLEEDISFSVTEKEDSYTLETKSSTSHIKIFADKLYEEGLIVKNGEQYVGLTIHEWDYNGEEWSYVSMNSVETYFRNGVEVGTDGVFNQNSAEIEENVVETIVTKEYESSGSILQSSISTWYRVLRTVALVGLLSVLVYVGIRILLTSVAADKAKYKKMLIDWVVAICILFILHYLMIFILTISSKLTEIVILEGTTSQMEATLPANTTLAGQSETLLKQVNANADEIESKYVGLTLDRSKMEKEGCPVWVGDYVGFIRLKAGVTKHDTAVTYGLMYLVLVIYTCMFTFMYIKRVLYMAFLTMIAPLIALTYPLDKIKDGKAQAFGLWIREYIFNALIQPVHLILYTMLLSNVLKLAEEHPVYALVALGFFTPAERFIRKMFGFESAGTVSALGQMAGGAAVMTAVNKLSKLNKRKKKDEEDDEKGNVRTKSEGGFNLPFTPGENSENGDGNSDQSQDAEVRTKNTPEGDGDSDQSQDGKARTADTPEEAGNSDQSQDGKARTTDAPKEAGNSDQSQDGKARTTENGTEEPKGGTIRDGFNAIGRHYGKKFIKAKPLRAAGRWTGRILAGATLGTVGLAAGIASGDPSKAFSYTAAGMGVGGALGGTLAENAMDEGKELRENFSKGYQGEAEYKNKKLDEEYYNGTGKGENFDELVEQKDLYSHLSGRERRKEMKKYVQDYRNSGITDNNKIATCMRAGLNPQEGVYAIKLAEAMEKGGYNSKKTREDYEKQFRDEMNGKMEKERVDKIWKTMHDILF